VGDNRHTKMKVNVTVVSCLHRYIVVDGRRHLSLLNFIDAVYHEQEEGVCVLSESSRLRQDYIYFVMA